MHPSILPPWCLLQPTNHSARFAVCWPTKNEQVRKHQTLLANKKMLANFLNTRQTFVCQHCWQTNVGQHLFVVCPQLISKEFAWSHKSQAYQGSGHGFTQHLNSTTRIGSVSVGKKDHRQFTTHNTEKLHTDKFNLTSYFMFYVRVYIRNPLIYQTYCSSYIRCLR